MPNSVFKELVMKYLAVNCLLEGFGESESESTSSDEGTAARSLFNFTTQEFHDLVELDLTSPSLETVSAAKAKPPSLQLTIE